MPTREKDWPAPATIGEDHVIVIDRASDGTKGALVPSLRDTFFVGMRRFGDAQTPDATPKIIVTIPIALTFMFSALVETVADDVSGAGVGAGAIRVRGSNPFGTVVGLVTFGDVESWSGSLAAVVAPTFVVSGGSLQIKVTGVAATTVNWRTVVTVSPYRAL